MTAPNRIPMLLKGEIELICATLTNIRVRDKQIDFSITYFFDARKLLVKKGGSVASIKELTGGKISVVNGTTAEEKVRRAQLQAMIVPFETYPEAFAALKQGKVATMAPDSGILLRLRDRDENPGDWGLVGEPLSAAPNDIGLPENDSKFRDFVNVALMELRDSGNYEVIYDRWFGKNTGFTLPLEGRLEVWPVDQ